MRREINPDLDKKNDKMFIINQYNNTTLRYGLIAEWLFDGNGTDTSGGGNDVSPNGYRNNKYAESNKAVDLSTTNSSFYGADVLDIGTSDYSFSFWTIADDLGSGTTITSCLTKSSAYNSTNLGEWRFYFHGSGYIAFGVRYDGATKTIQSTAGSIVIDTWYHIVGTIDRDGYQRLYINNNEVGTAQSISSYSANDLNNASRIGFGRLDNAIPRQLDGGLDNVRLYNRLLSTTEIALLYAE